jgi:hypothetical protein
VRALALAPLGVAVALGLVLGALLVWSRLGRQRRRPPYEAAEVYRIEGDALDAATPTEMEMVEMPEVAPDQETI